MPPFFVILRCTMRCRRLMVHCVGSDFASVAVLDDEPDEFVSFGV
jgi:hypothetical protein